MFALNPFSKELFKKNPKSTNIRPHAVSLNIPASSVLILSKNISLKYWTKLEKKP